MTIEVLIVDDAPFVALDLEDTVFEAGFMALSPCGSVSGAFTLLGRRLPDCAILDISLADGDVFPVADRLRDAGVPIIFHTGTSDTADVHARYPDAFFCLKPCSHAELSGTLRRVISSKMSLLSQEREASDCLANVSSNSIWPWLAELNPALGAPLKGIFGKLRGHVATIKTASQIWMVNHSLIRTANLHRWLTSIAGDLHWDRPLLCDALLETYYWVIGPMLAIDPDKLQPSNDHVA